jgi:hypothetical protein
VSYRQVNARQWEWQAPNGKWHSVQLFASTRRVIWSGWTNSGDGPVFDEGIAQSFERLLSGEAPPVPIPDGLLDVLKKAMSK